MASGVGITTYSEYGLSMEPIATPGWQDTTDFLVVLQSMEDPDGIFPAERDYARLRVDIMARLSVYSNLELACRQVRVALRLPEYFVSKYRVTIFESREAMYRAMTERCAREGMAQRVWNQQRRSSKMIKVVEEEALVLKREYPGVRGLDFLRLVPDLETGEEQDSELTRLYTHSCTDEAIYLGPMAYRRQSYEEYRVGPPLPTGGRIGHTKYYLGLQEEQRQPDLRAASESVFSGPSTEKTGLRLRLPTVPAQRPALSMLDANEVLALPQRPVSHVSNNVTASDAATSRAAPGALQARTKITLRLTTKSANVESKVTKPKPKPKESKRSRSSYSPPGLTLNLGQLKRAIAERSASKSSSEDIQEPSSASTQETACTVASDTTKKLTVEEEFAECARAAQLSAGARVPSSRTRRPVMRPSWKGE